MDVFRGIRRMEDLLLEGRRVLIRVDFNCPLTPEGEVADDARIEAALPTLKYAVEQGAKVVLASHLGRPKGRRVPELSMTTVGERLRELLSRDLGREMEIFVPDDCVGDGPRKVVMERVEGEVVLLENLRFYAEEEANDNVFAQRLAALCDIYVNDAFASSHRAHASVSAVTRHVAEKGVGQLMARELSALGKLLGLPDQPFALVLGGARVSEKLGAVNSLLGKLKLIVVGGGTANTFLAARGLPVGASHVETDRLEVVQNLMSRARLRGVEVLLPVDVVFTRPGADEGGEAVPIEALPPDATIVDIGPETRALYAQALAGARTVFWNGPMGVYEKRPFIAGTEAVGKAIARSRATSVVAGGDTVTAVTRLALRPFFQHVSTGGTSALEFLEGKELPGIEALREAT